MSLAGRHLSHRVAAEYGTGGRFGWQSAQCIISQQLVPTVDGDSIPVFEIMTINPALRNMIRERKIPQIEGQIYNSSSDTMCSMDSSLLKLFRSGKIARQTALDYASNPEMLLRNLGR